MVSWGGLFSAVSPVQQGLAFSFLCIHLPIVPWVFYYLSPVITDLLDLLIHTRFQLLTSDPQQFEAGGTPGLTHESRMVRSNTWSPPVAVPSIAVQATAVIIVLISSPLLQAQQQKVLGDLAHPPCLILGPNCRVTGYVCTVHVFPFNV